MLLERFQTYSEWNDTSYEAWRIPGERWNGWECPWFSWSVAKIVAKNNGGFYDADRDGFWTNPDGTEVDPETANEVDHEFWPMTWMNGRGYYRIGAMCWIWSEAE